ncbi:MAG: bifunctional phosphopantothenoylcysteine decarboxylase/phosphopantothenate--cysteine ligase CoaBC [Bacteroidales bacterium]|nr:bifunctional phosphopantothenoylcysteine decarboxylase/phosphopantothenate--cysteine ligase CoaBC [Candidatus Physcousia equi]
MLKGKHIVLGITGSIAAYKACLLIRLLIKEGAEVQVVITPSGKEFITPLTLSTLTHKPVVSEFFDRRDGSWHSHVDLGLWADLMVIAPATASTIGKMAHGIADNMLITTYLSMKAPVVVAPAMDLDMYAHPSTQANLNTLRSYGNHIVEPGTGHLASNLEGKGRMEEPENIVKAIKDILHGVHGTEADRDTSHPLSTKSGAACRILITAGPTYEKIDPVRFIGNYSSGKMGIALAEECAERGAIVELICGPVAINTPHPNIHRTDVESAAEMYEAATRLFPSCHAGILCAAVADFTPALCADKKIKREVLRENDELVLHLQPTQDIARSLGQCKRNDQVLVGFALETNDEVAHAQDKLRKKNLDFIVMNSLRDAGAGFQHDTNKVSIISQEGRTDFPLKTKKQVAADIVDHLAKLI